MEADPAVEPALDTVSLILPLPYRVAVIFVLGMYRCNCFYMDTLADDAALGVWAWGLNLHYLSILKIVRIGLATFRENPTKISRRMF